MSDSSAVSRRRFLKMAGVGAALFGAGSVRALGGTPRAASANRPSGVAKNILFLVADGMNIAAPSLANTHLLVTGAAPSSHWMRLYRELPVVRALCETRSASSLVTDSAAAASAWGLGRRVNNGAINVTPSGESPDTLLMKLAAAGKRTGLVTTATATHATPAGFVATVPAREDQATVARQYLERGVDVIMGGGREYFSEAQSALYAKAGYRRLSCRADLLSAGPDAPLLGVFAKGYLPFEIDRENTPALREAVPSLAEMTEAALRRLAPAKDGFFLLVEGGRVDHAGHGNDAAASIHDMLAFDRALGVALSFVEKNPDTLLIVTTDHGTGGLQLNGVGKSDFGGNEGAYGATDRAFENLTRFTASFEALRARAKGMKGREINALLLEHTRLPLSAADLAAFRGFASMPELMAKYTGTAWTSHDHTGELVEFCAYGPGAGLFPAFVRNDEVHAKLLRAFGLA